jgi:hypothetical protein
MTFTDWVQVITQIVVAATAVIMAYLAWRTYLKAPEQEPESEKEKTEEIVSEKLIELLVFKTSKQKTKLKVTSQGLECHLEDKREGKGGHQWTLSKHEVKNILSMGSYSVNPGFKATVGTFSIGPRRNWLYSKPLFPDPDYLRNEIKQLLENVSR